MNVARCVNSRLPSRVSRWIAALALAICASCLMASDALAGAFDVKDNTWEKCTELLDIARTELGAARVQAIRVLN